MRYGGENIGAYGGYKAGIDQANVAITGGTISGVSIANPTFTGTVTASQVTGIERVVTTWSVPAILASSGSMGNNGAVSAMTALPKTYSGGAWLYLPANAIQAGSAAGFYWFVASSTTAGTVYNSTWDGTGIPAAGTTTAFVSTGPGAFTGIATGEIVVATVAIGAGHIGPNGELDIRANVEVNTAAGNKIPRVRFSGAAGAAYFSPTLSTSSPGIVLVNVRNQGTGQQIGSAYYQAGTGVLSTSGNQYGTADTTAATSVVFSLEKATATNHAIWNGATVRVAYGA